MKTFHSVPSMELSRKVAGTTIIFIVSLSCLLKIALLFVLITGSSIVAFSLLFLSFQ